MLEMTPEELKQQEELNEEIDKSLSLLPLEKNEVQIVNSIIDAPSKQELEVQFELFNMNQMKKNALRIIKLNDLLTKVEDQAIERFEKRPGEISNKELLEYMNVVSNQIEKAQNFNAAVLNPDKPGIKVTNQKNEVNINVAPVVDKENVMDAVSALLKQIQQNRTDEINKQYIDSDTVETVDDQNSTNEIVYSIETHPESEE